MQPILGLVFFRPVDNRQNKQQLQTPSTRLGNGIASGTELYRR